MLATVLHLHRGTPYVYQGEELGMTNAPFNTIEDFRDIESLNHYAEAVAGGAAPDDVLLALRTMGRDNARTPDAVGRGRATPASRPASRGSPVNPNHVEINAEAALADPDSVFHHYRRLIELRHSLPVIADGDFTMLLEDDERVYAFTRSLDGVELLVLGNFTGDRGGKSSSRAGTAPRTRSSGRRAWRWVRGRGRRCGAQRPEDLVDDDRGDRAERDAGERVVTPVQRVVAGADDQRDAGDRRG